MRNVSHLHIISKTIFQNYYNSNFVNTRMRIQSKENIVFNKIPIIYILTCNTICSLKRSL